MSPTWSGISGVKQGSKPAHTLDTYGRGCLLLQSMVMSREPQLDHVKRVEDLKAHSPKWDLGRRRGRKVTGRGGG